jgi:hypothetical protein
MYKLLAYHKLSQSRAGVFVKSSFGRELPSACMEAKKTRQNNWLKMRIVAVNCYSQFIKNHLWQPSSGAFVCLIMLQRERKVGALS